MLIVSGDKRHMLTLGKVAAISVVTDRETVVRSVGFDGRRQWVSRCSLKHNEHY